MLSLQVIKVAPLTTLAWTCSGRTRPASRNGEKGEVLEKNGGPRVDRKQYGPLVAYALRDAVPRPPPSGAVAVAGGPAAAVPAGAAGACGCRPGGGPRGRQQRRAVGGAQARAEAAAAALAAAVPRRAGPSPGTKAAPHRVTAVSWVKHYFADVPQEAVQAHFNRRMVSPFPFWTGRLAFLTVAALIQCDHIFLSISIDSEFFDY